MQHTMLIVWLVLIALFLVVEIATLGLTTVWFAGGALVAFFVGLFGGGLEFQIAAFFIVSLVLLLSVRPSACRRFNKGRMKTNLEGFLEMQGKVIETIDNFNEKGTVLMDGKEWTARSEDGSLIEVGEKVMVAEIKGVKLIVKKVGNNSF